MTATPPTKRRRFQFSLRTLMLLMLLTCIAMGWFVARMRRAERQREAVEEIRKLRGDVFYDYQVDSAGGTIQGIEPLAPKWLRKLVGDDLFADVAFVDAGFFQMTDARVEHLKGLTQLRYLELSRSKITDAGLGHLRELSELRRLWLDNTEVTDAGLEHLRGLRELKVLFLRNTQVTDVGLAHLRELRQLEVLFLDGTRVTDAGLKHLRGSMAFKLLCLANTKVTDPGVQELQQVLPNCEIVR